MNLISIDSLLKLWLMPAMPLIQLLDGEEGHFLGDTEPYDAVVLDLGLPRMDGISVLRAMAAQSS